MPSDSSDRDRLNGCATTRTLGVLISHSGRTTRGRSWAKYLPTPRSPNSQLGTSFKPAAFASRRP
eukprot:3419760-Rhodomonas_salina.1